MHRVRKMMSQLENCDGYTQLAVYGSWLFAINASCINQAMRYIPNADNESGIDGYTLYEAARRTAIREAETSQLPSLLCLQRELTSSIENADGNPQSLDDTLQFLTSNAPSRATFEAEYEHRRRIGLNPGMSKRTFVDHEYERAMAQHNSLVSRGEDAVRLCETLTFEDKIMESQDLPLWIPDAFEQKFIAKLHSRWEKLEFNRSNPRRQKAIRDAAAADQMQIAAVLAEYGEQPGFNEQAADAVAA